MSATPAERMRLYRQRRRRGIQYVRIPLHVTEIDELIHSPIRRWKDDDPRTDAEVVQSCGFDTRLKRLRDDDVRLYELHQKEVNPKESGGPLTAADEQERVMLRARVDETVKALRCPPGYGAVEARKDRLKHPARRRENA
jgi:hypothetical protein